MITIKSPIFQQMGIKSLKKGETAIITEGQFSGTLVFKTHNEIVILSKNQCLETWIEAGNFFEQDHQCKLVNLDVVIKEIV